MRFLHLWWLIGLAGLPLLWWLRRRRLPAALRFSNTAALPIQWGWTVRWHKAIPVVRLLTLAALIVGLARPQAGAQEYQVVSEGVEIVLTLDISKSMLAEDLKPQNRLAAAKEAARAFIRKRQHDRIGLVVFARHAMTQCPLTTDYGVLEQLLDLVDVGMIEDGTAIGTAIATSANRLKRSLAKSKVMILLTDGENNAGEVDPITAANAAAAFGIKIYTVGAGRPGAAPIPVDDPIFGRRYGLLQTRLDEETLQGIARVSGGRYFRAHDAEGLARVYEEIDRLEKTKIKSTEHLHYEERMGWVVWPALLLLVLELGLRRTWLLELP